MVSGQLADGTPFSGTDVTRVIDPGGGPHGTAVVQVSPNPVEGGTRISYELAAPGPVRLQIYDAVGRLVRTLASGTKPAGRHEVTWDRKTDHGSQVNAGVYFVRLEQGGMTDAEKLLILN